jgi:hypothetical protein
MLNEQQKKRLDNRSSGTVLEFPEDDKDYGPDSTDATDSPLVFQ